MLDLGIVKPGSVVRIPFTSFDKDDGSAITMTNFAAADILVYKDGSTTERASTSGYTATTDFDAKTGKHLAVIDLADNTTAGFWNAGSEYLVAIDSVTIDTVTTGGWVARFKIGYPGAVLDTTIATLSSQTSFTLTAGPAEDDALNGSVVVIHDIASAVQAGYAYVLDYTGASKTVTLTAGTTFTAAAGDNISVLPRHDLSYILGALVSTSTAQLGVNVVNAAGTAWNSGAIGAATLATDTITNAKIAADAIGASEIADGAIDAGAIATDAVQKIRRIFNGTADSGTTTTLVDAELTQSNTNHWAGCNLLITSGTMSGMLFTITSFVPATDTITFAPAAPTAITTETYDILPNGRSNVGAIEANAITNASIATNALSSSKFFTGAITADALATDAVAEIVDAVWDELQSDHLVSGSFGELGRGIIVASGTADSGSNSSQIVDAERTENVTDWCKGNYVVPLSGTAKGQARRIDAFNTSTDTITVFPSFTGSIAAGDRYVIVGQGDVTVAAMASDVLDATALAGSAANEIRDAVWAATASSLTTWGSIGNVLRQGMVSGRVNDGAATTTSFNVDGFTETTANHFDRAYVIFTSGALLGQMRPINSYVSGTLSFTLAWTEAPADNDEFLIVPYGLWLISNSQPRSAFISGDIGTAAITADTIAANAIGASELAADAIAEIADAVWDEVRSGHTTAGTYGQSTQATFMGAVASATASTLVLGTESYGTAASASDDFYNGLIVLVLAGTGEGQQRTIVDYVGSSKTITPDGNWTTTPDNTSKVVILGV